MGASMSTLGGWAVVLCIAGYYAFRYMDGGRRREIARAAAHKQKSLQARKEEKDKAKRQRGEAYSKDAVADADRTAKPKLRSPKPPTTSAIATTTTTAATGDTSSDDGVDNREFARQLASVKQGTNFAAKKSDEKRQKSVKQSRAQERDDRDRYPHQQPSAPSSTAGADADDDQSPLTSPEVRAADSHQLVADMLERPAPGPSVLRLTDTDKEKAGTKPKRVKTPEKTETKKQRQNRQKAEAAKLAREEAEKERKAKMEQQRRLARISEGRPAKDGSAFMAAAQKQGASVWNGNGVNGSSSPPGGNASGGESNGRFLPVQPLDTFSSKDSTPRAEAAAATTTTTTTTSRPLEKAESWMSSLPSEEEQMEMLREEEAWSTVKTKKAAKSKKKDEHKETREDEVAPSAPEKAAPTKPEPALPAKTPKSAGLNGKPAKTLAQPSVFAALGSEDPVEEEEWDV